jgi:hypothetical protein
MRLIIGSARAELLKQKADCKRSRREISKSDMARHKHTGPDCKCGYNLNKNSMEDDIFKICDLVMSAGLKKQMDKLQHEKDLYHELMVDAGITQ